MKKNKLLSIIGLFVLSIIWGANVPFMKSALDFSGPAEFAFIRNFFGAFVLFGILLVLKKPLLIKEAPKLFILGLFQTTGFTGFLIWALLEGGASKTVILVFTMPLWVAMMAWPFLRERLSALQWLAIAISFLGIGIIFNPLNEGNNILSCLLALASGFSWACGVILSKKIHIKFPKLDLLTMTAWQMLWGSIPLFIILFIVNSEPIIWTNYFICIVLFNIIFVNAIAYLLWFFSLKHLEASSVSILSLMTPIAGGVSAWLLLNEIPNNSEKIGYFLILLGIFSLLFYKNNKKN
ncbi:EamA family transporter [Methylophilaceae bacterium]|jgi:drug/metabolite transporter (DMT)-like permease|nr:EamA family transporter [Methylophilaceae bacterium]|tara:strand:- start:763 stop:1644 length:882 start_codon:yes stop_codon:yes gene_type:complete